MINLDRGVESCNAINDLLKICVPNKTEDLNLNVFNMIIKPRSCKCKYKFDDRICNLNQKWNNDKTSMSM